MNSPYRFTPLPGVRVLGTDLETRSRTKNIKIVGPNCYFEDSDIMHIEVYPLSRTISFLGLKIAPSSCYTI